MSKDMAEAEEIIVEFTDEEGNTYEYVQDCVVTVDGEDFACLISVDEIESGADEVDIVISKIVQDANGEDEYIEPTDEEFAKVMEVYEEMEQDEDETF